jgi:predicted nucleic-acid-binding Zn-ribbon protein
MKTSGRCPKCGCGKLYVVEEVRQPAQESINGIVKLCVTTAAVSAQDVGLTERNDHRAEIGRFDAWICSACGLTEWYAKDFAPAFERLIALGRKVHVRVAKAPDAEPYR